MQKIRNLFICSATESKKTYTIVVTAFFIALNIAINALGLRIEITQELRISFGFITNAMVGMLFGPVMGMTAGATSDILSYIIHPTGSGYFPGFTLTAILGGLFYGLGLYGGKMTVGRALLTKVSVSFFLNICLNSVWLKILYGKAFWVLLPMRIGKNLMMLPLEVALLYCVGRIVERIHSRSAAPSS